MTLLGQTFKATYNAAPTQQLPIIRQIDSNMELSFARWGLMPSWAKNTKIKPFFNARGDNLHCNKVFWSSRDRHCIVPMNGFYEWSEKDKQPYYIYSPEKQYLPVAGLWRTWSNGVESFDTYCLITTTPHPVLRDIHHRSPVILTNEESEQWLGSDYENGKDLIKEFSGALEKHEVTKLVNSSSNNDAILIRKANKATKNMQGILVVKRHPSNELLDDGDELVQELTIFTR